MKRKQRRFSDRVQLVVDEMLHLLGHSSTSSATAARGRSLQLTKLEERVLMSASPMAMVAEVATVAVESSHEVATFDVGALNGAIDVVAADSSPVVNVDADAGFNTDTGSITETGLVADDAADDRSSDTAISSTPTVSDIELIVLDSRVQDADTLLSELLNSDRDFRILRLDSETDGVAQITEKLEQVGHVSAIHLLTHGTDGEILLGSTVLNASTLAQYAPEFLAWQHNLTDNADLLLYGCDVAQTTVGEDFVDALAGLAETDVAASTNATGSDALGGDWDLEFAVGSVQATTAFRTSVAQNWNDLLNVTLTDKSEFAVNTTTSNTQITSGETRGSQHAVSLAADGSYVVVWSSLNQDGSGYGVYARRFDAAGNPLTSEILINQSTSNNQQWARVASADDGTFVVTWTHGTAGSEDVFFRKFSANGTAQTTETRANNTTANSQKNSVIAMDRTTGQFVIAWQGEGPGDTSSIFFRRFASNGTATEVTDQLVNPAGTHSEQDPAIAMQTAGGFVIAFERGDSNKVYFQRFNSSGTKVGSETQIDNLLATSFGIDIASNAAGDFTVVYREQSLLPGIWQRGFNADGTQKYTWSQISSGDGVSPSIAMMGDGSYIVTWQKTGDSDATGIYAQRYNSDGSANGAEFLVNSTTTGAQSQSSVAALDAANFVVVWSGQGSTDTDGVYARQVHFSPPMLDLDANNSSGATAGNFAATFTSGGGSVAIADADATLVDVDSANLQSLVVTITNRQNGSSESLTAVTAGTNITASYFDGVLTLSGADTVANYQQVLRTVRYANSSTPTTGASRTITFVANDGVVKSEVATTSLTITGAAAAPPASNGGIVTGNEDTPSVFAWSDFNITDVDTAITSTTAIRLTTLPASGKLKYFNGTEWTEVGLGQVLTKADIDSGALRFQPDADESGYDGYATAGVGNMMQDYAQFNFTPLQTTIETIFNPGAEVDGLSENSVLTNATGWNSSGSGTTGAFNPASSAETYISDHDAAFYVNSGGVLTQTLGSSFDATKNYNLSFEFGWLGDTATYPTEPGFTVELFAGSTLLGAFTHDYVSGVPGEFKSCVLQIDGSLSGASNGSSLQIRIAGTSGKANFDNFELVSFDRTTGVGTAALMIVDVSPVNDAPVVTSNGGGATVSVTLAENTSALTTVTATDVDAPSQVLTYSISGLDAVSFTINSSTGALAFVTAPNFELPTDAGLDNVYDIIVLVSDGIDTGSQAIAVAVSNVNEQPVAGNDTYTAAEDQTLTVPVGSGLLANDAEPEGQAITILDYTLPGHGTVALNSDGSFSYTPDADYYGSDEFGYVSIDSTPGLIHYWRMDGTGDDLIGGADGTVNGATPVMLVNEATLCSSMVPTVTLKFRT
jgi:hypothetical protein